MQDFIYAFYIPFIFSAFIKRRITGDVKSHLTVHINQFIDASVTKYSTDTSSQSNSKALIKIECFSNDVYVLVIIEDTSIIWCTNKPKQVAYVTACFQRKPKIDLHWRISVVIKAMCINILTHFLINDWICINRVAGGLHSTHGNTAHYESCYPVRAQNRILINYRKLLPGKNADIFKLQISRSCSGALPGSA